MSDQVKKVVLVSGEVLSKYNVAKHVHGKMDFGNKFGDVVIDLPNATAEEVDEFVAQYRDQKFFTLKNPVSETPDTVATPAVVETTAQTATSAPDTTSAAEGGEEMGSRRKRN